MDLLLARRRMMMPKAAAPYDAKVEYLESTGTQYIDTNCIPNGTDIHLVLDGQFTETSNTIFGTIQSGSYRFGLECYNGRFVFGCDGRVAGFVTYDTNRHTFELWYDGKTSIDGSISQIASVTEQSYNYSIYLFGRNLAGSINACAKAKIFSCKIYKDSLIHDFIPVRVGQVGYMYDRVSGQLFGNIGTGDFALGPDVI